MTLPLRWSIITTANAGEHAAARRRLRCSVPDSARHVREVESFLRDEPVGVDDRLLIGRFGPDTVALAWWTSTEGCVSKVLAYGVHPAYRAGGATAQELLGWVIDHRRAVATAAYCPGFMLWCFVDPANASSASALGRAGFVQAESEDPPLQKWTYVERF